MKRLRLVEHSKPFVLYAHVEEQLRAEFVSAAINPGARLPTELELCKRFGVSRSTIRQSLNRLEADGLITRTRGKGTFLRAKSIYKAAVDTVNTTTNNALTLRKVLGLVFCARSDTLQMNILLGVERAAKSRGYGIMFGYSGEDARAEEQEIERLLHIGADGVIVMPVSNTTATPGVQRLIEHKTPTVLVDRYLTDLDTSYVVSDGFGGAYRLTEHLILLGYTSFVYINSGMELLATSSVRDRFRGYCQALEDYGIPVEQCEPLAVRVGDTNSVRELLSRRSNSRTHGLAIVAVHDAVAIALMRTAASIGLKPPEDFAVVGFDDLPVSSHLPVPLTTVMQPRYDIGFKSGHQLIDMIEGREVTDEKLVLPVSMTVRESCGAHRIMRERRMADALHTSERVA